MAKKTVPEYITPVEAKAIIEACPECIIPPGRKGDVSRDKLILRTMWETGGRVAEVLSLIRFNLDLVNNCIRLPNLKQGSIRKKKKESQEEFEISRDNHLALMKQRKEMMILRKAPLLDKYDPPLKRVFLFPESTLCQDLINYAIKNNIGDYEWIFQGQSRDGRVSTTYMWYLLSSEKNGSYSSDKWKRTDGIFTSLRIGKIKKSGGGIPKPGWPHLFRHGAAMNIYRETGRLDAAQHQLGHSSIQATEIYTGMTDEDRKDIIDGKHRTDK